MNLQAPELMIILVVILVLFGGAKLPKLARSLGQAQKEFKDGMRESDTPPAPTTDQVTDESSTDAPPEGETDGPGPS